MKYAKLTLALVVVAAAVVLFGRSLSVPTAQAEPTAVVTINPLLCLTLTAGDADWDNNGVTDAADTSSGLFNCINNLGDEGVMAQLVLVLRDEEGTGGVRPPLDGLPEPEEFAAIDRDGGQIHEQDGELWFIAFVSNDDPVAFFADEGIFAINGASSASCGPVTVPASYDFQEEDCDDDGVEGDGIVAIKLRAASVADRGLAEARIRQGRLEIPEEYTVVGEPDEIELSASQNLLQTGTPACALFGAIDTLIASLQAPETSPVTATVLDSDGTALANALVAWETEDADVVSIFGPLTPTLDIPGLGVLAPNVLCGAEDPGTITIRAQISRNLGPGTPDVDIGAEQEDAEVEITVQGPPVEIEMTADPSSLVCDGTASTTIKATLTDADGNPAVDGNRVKFDARTLGTLNPIMAQSTDGVASTAATPLASITSGMTVRGQLYLPNLNGAESGDECDDGVDTNDDGILDEAEDDDDDDYVNDGCPAVGTKESGSCAKEMDDDQDGFVNDGCPVSTGEGDDPAVPGDEILVPGIEDSVLAQCTGATIPPSQPPAAPPAAPPAIQPPRTGSAGLLP